MGSTRVWPRSVRLSRRRGNRRRRRDGPRGHRAGDPIRPSLRPFRTRAPGAATPTTPRSPRAGSSPGRPGSESRRRRRSGSRTPPPPARSSRRRGCGPATTSSSRPRPAAWAGSLAVIASSYRPACWRTMLTLLSALSVAVQSADTGCRPMCRDGLIRLPQILHDQAVRASASSSGTQAAICAGEAWPVGRSSGAAGVLPPGTPAPTSPCLLTAEFALDSGGVRQLA